MGILLLVQSGIPIVGMGPFLQWSIFKWHLTSELNIQSSAANDYTTAEANFQLKLFIRLPPEFFPVSGPWTWRCASTLGAALL